MTWHVFVSCKDLLLHILFVVIVFQYSCVKINGTVAYHGDHEACCVGVGSYHIPLGLWTSFPVEQVRSLSSLLLN